MLETAASSSVHCREILIRLSAKKVSVFPGLCPVYKKELSLSRPGTALLRKACLDSWPLAGTWHLRLGQFPPFPEGNERLLVLYAVLCSVAFADYLLSFCESGNWVHAREMVPPFLAPR